MHLNCHLKVSIYSVLYRALNALRNSRIAVDVAASFLPTFANSFAFGAQSHDPELLRQQRRPSPHDQLSP
jgi:hypothetical protein